MLTAAAAIAVVVVIVNAPIFIAVALLDSEWSQPTKKIFEIKCKQNHFQIIPSSFEVDITDVVIDYLLFIVRSSI